ncbi:MAG: hypothetical protein IJ817_00715, partial [Clostridia bacterium]|nr:hypothetical protein [Clostridia bacterium]
MNEKKTKKFNLVYVLVLVVVALLAALIFVDFGNTGKELSSGHGMSVLENGSYYEEYDAVGDPIESSKVEISVKYVVFKNGTAYIIVNNSKYSKTQVPTYADYHFSYSTQNLETLEGICASAHIDYDFREAGISAWDIIVPIIYV